MKIFNNISKNTKNTSILQVNSKTFYNIVILNTYKKTFEFGHDCIKILIDVIKYYNKTILYFLSIYTKIAK